ncbi:hypothetical protein LOK49_LG06G03198 [Camellia lanceoleosa]|uniref:Uncharacterized protein n=1 Tax=Camellia lanceoleosa TaxID=1840588 RepID=A0ACC0HBQ1_9ERIC|nr:hypothetical protein LOK49_LG06G03198 [Camellia lanceoleosa]
MIFPHKFVLPNSLKEREREERGRGGRSSQPSARYRLLPIVAARRRPAHFQPLAFTSSASRLASDLPPSPAPTSASALRLYLYPRLRPLPLPLPLFLLLF